MKAASSRFSAEEHDGEQSSVLSRGSQKLRFIIHRYILPDAQKNVREKLKAQVGSQQKWRIFDEWQLG